MFGEHAENVFVENWRYGAVGEVEAQHVDYAGGVVLDEEMLGRGFEGEHKIL